MARSPSGIYKKGGNPVLLLGNLRKLMMDSRYVTMNLMLFYMKFDSDTGDL